jgi:hypothetical protein
VPSGFFLSCTNRSQHRTKTESRFIQSPRELFLPSLFSFSAKKLLGRVEAQFALAKSKQSWDTHSAGRIKVA